MADNHTNQTDFAKKLRVTRQAVHKAITSGVLVLHGKGRTSYIDMDCPKTKAYIKSASTNRHRPKSTKPRGKPAPVLPKADRKKSGPEEPDDDNGADEYRLKSKADHLKRLQEIEKLSLANKARRKELIERDMVQDFIDELFTIHNGQLKTLGLRASADVAAIFNIEDDDKIREACDKIDTEMFAVLKQIKRLSNKYLRKIKGKIIDDKQAA